LAISCVLGVFTGARWPVPLAGWLAPVFAMRFVELQSRYVGFFATIVCSWFVFFVSNWGAIPVPIEQYLLTGLIVAVLGYGLIVVHLRAIRRWPNGFGTLVYPSLLVSLEYLSSFAIFGTWTSTAVLQAPLLALAQLASITGIWGISFLVLWTSALLHWAWSRGLKQSDVMAWLGGWAMVLLLVFGFGQWRLMYYSDLPKPLLAAGIAPRINGFMDESMRDAVRALRDPAGVDDATMQRLGERIRELLLLSQQAVDAGACLVCWSEAAMVASPATRLEFDRACSDFARTHGVVLAATLGEMQPPAVPSGVSAPSNPIRNLLVVFGPDGGRLLEQQKFHIPPGEPSIPGDGQIQVFEWGAIRMAGVICFDTDFPSSIRQVGRQRGGLLLAPSNDWPEAARTHLAVASYRTIENGCSLLRPTTQGISVGLDPLGRPLSEMDAFATEDSVFMVHLPVASVPTLYSRLGDWFAWLPMGLSLAFATTALVSRRAIRTVGGSQEQRTVPKEAS